MYELERERMLKDLEERSKAGKPLTVAEKFILERHEAAKVAPKIADKLGKGSALISLGRTPDPETIFGHYVKK